VQKLVFLSLEVTRSSAQYIRKFFEKALSSYRRLW